MSYESKGTSCPKASQKRKEGEPQSSNKLLAGYMAYEFLTKGTQFGKQFNPAQTEVSEVASSAEQRQKRWCRSKVQQNEEGEPTSTLVGLINYPEVAKLVGSNEVHIPELVNPTQLARWIKM